MEHSLGSMGERMKKISRAVLVERLDVPGCGGHRLSSVLGMDLDFSSQLDLRGDLNARRLPFQIIPSARSIWRT